MPADPRERRATAGAAVETDPLLAELSGRHRRLVWPLVALFLTWYLLLMLLAGYLPRLLSHPVGGHVNLAYLLALSQFPTTFLVAWGYSRQARRRLDPLTARLRAEHAARSDAAAAQAAYEEEVATWPTEAFR
jgi:uncharacterized membrane protein (DUF485 family)